MIHYGLLFAVFCLLPKSLAFVHKGPQWGAMGPAGYARASKLSKPQVGPLAAQGPLIKDGAHKLDGRELSGELKPIQDGLLIAPKEFANHSPGGLLLSSEAQSNYVTGQIRAMGTGLPHPQTGAMMEVGLKQGDWVLYRPSNSTKINYDSEDLVILGSLSVVAKINSGEGEVQMSTVRPFYDMILIELKDQEEHSAGGLFMESKSVYGTVRATGPGGYSMNGGRIPIDVAAGDQIILRNKVYREDAVLRLQDKKCIFVRINEILAKW